ncbi:uncharacterized protein [Malus domestica]|uniref:uncharacterized protein n=1 Tax=Malus domestica TaxID=3750 RepID=UPI003975ABDE
MATSASPSSNFGSHIHSPPIIDLSPNFSGASQIASITIQNIRSMVPIKLTMTNYLTWSALVNSSRELWAKLESRFATASQLHIHELRSHFQSLTKGDSFAAQFLQQIKEIADALASAGAPSEDSELISIILHGISPEYDSFVDGIQFHLGSTTIDELHGPLLNREIQLNNRKKTSQSSSFQAFNSSSGVIPTPTSQALMASHNSNSNFSQGRGLERNNA